MGWPGDSPRVPVLLQGHCWIGLQGQGSPGEGVINPHMSTSGATSRKPLSCTHSCGREGQGGAVGDSATALGCSCSGGDSRETWKVGEAVLPQKQHIPTSLYPCNLLYPCVLSHHIPASGQAFLWKNVPPKRADSAPKHVGVFEVSLIFFFFFKLGNSRIVS